MKLFELLKERGFFAKDIRSRFKNNQIKVNGEPVTEDFELPKIDKIIDPGEALAILCQNDKWALQLSLIGLDNIIGSNIETDLKDKLQEFVFIKTSKKDSFVIVT